ncbi:MAG: hypothetical protein BJ554DRAFT_7461 [Olpidium bornovanus]|uniref:Uncharacterized protein n=1 Tax=Olpidium bornovanus TaxID=278681 RepID=A0A8H7ZW39_9FUNG|nr:MAG: hypothetical protein BJ554DRAFT_7461 [Olpidium bornovanus]
MVPRHRRKRRPRTEKQTKPHTPDVTPVRNTLSAPKSFPAAAAAAAPLPATASSLPVRTFPVTATRLTAATSPLREHRRSCLRRALSAALPPRDAAPSSLPSHLLHRDTRTANKGEDGRREQDRTVAVAYFPSGPKCGIHNCRNCSDAHSSPAEPTFPPAESGREELV